MTRKTWIFDTHLYDATLLTKYIKDLCKISRWMAIAVDTNTSKWYCYYSLKRENCEASITNCYLTYDRTDDYWNKLIQNCLSGAFGDALEDTISNLQVSRAAIVFTDRNGQVISSESNNKSRYLEMVYKGNDYRIEFLIDEPVSKDGTFGVKIFKTKGISEVTIIFQALGVFKDFPVSVLESKILDKEELKKFKEFIPDHIYQGVGG